MLYSSLLRSAASLFLLLLAMLFFWWLFHGRRWLASLRHGTSFPVMRAILVKGLGILWLVAGLLQAQPDMFTTDFYVFYPTKVMPSLLQQTADGQPAWLAGLIHTGSQLWGYQPILFNTLVIVLQVGLGVFLLFGSPGLVNLALRVSVLWGLVVWVGGEGMGNTLSRGGNFFLGWPGSALLYAVAAVLSLMPEGLWRTRFPVYLKGLLGLFWLLMACLQWLPRSDYWKPSGLMSIFANAATVKQPQLLSKVVQSFALYIVNHSVLMNFMLGLVMVGIGVLHLLPVWPKWALDVTLLWLLWSWWFGQDFGTLFAGLGTDLNTAPLLALITLVAWFGQLFLYNAHRSSRRVHEEAVK